MSRYNLRNRHSRDVGPPAIRLLDVYKHREEDDTRAEDVDIDDANARKPSDGETFADASTLKTRVQSLNIGTWNTRTLFKTGKLDNLLLEAENMKMDILGVAETHWTGSGIIRRSQHCMIYSGGEDHRRGVGIVLNAKVSKCLLGYWPVNERILMCKIQARPFNLIIIQCYAPTADQPDEDIESFYTDIETTLKQTKSDDIVFIIGDFNSKVGMNHTSDKAGKFSLGTTNERGEMLIDFCERNNYSIMNTFFKHPKRRLYTWKSPGDVSRNQIDYILVKDRFKNNVKKCKTFPGADIGSDHNPVVAEVMVKLKTPKISKMNPKIDLAALKIPDIKENFTLTVKNKFESLMEEGDEQTPKTSNDTVNKIWGCLKTAITESQETVLPKYKREKKKPWMTKEILDMMVKRRSKKGTAEYNSIDKDIRRKCRTAKENWANEKCRNIEELSKKHQTKTMFKVIKEMTAKRSSASSCIRNKDGDILFEADKILERWKEYVEDLFNDSRPANPIKNFLQGPEILKSEVENAIKTMSKGKAVGVDNISTESLQALGDFGTEKLTEICNEIYHSAEIPEDLRTSIFIVLPKKPSATECSDHRTISLMCHTLKLLLTIILRRMSDKINKNVGPEQAGFRKESGTREGIFNLRMLVEKHIEMQRDVYACFIDYSKAFDTVKHCELIKCLETTDIEENDIAIISNLYWQQQTKIRIDNNISDPLNIQRGVRQGCVLSPALFNLYTDTIFRKIEHLPGLKIGGRNINNLRYADDTVLLAEDENTLQEIVDVVKKESEKFGLLMNTKKTKTMVFSKKQETPQISIKIDDKIIEQVDSFQYLGSTVTQDGRCEREIKRRIALAKNKFSNMTWLLTCHDLSLKTKIRLAKCYVWSILLYGCETWTLTSTLEKKVRSFEMWTYRRIARVSWKEKKTNQQVLEKLGIQSTEIMTSIRKRIVKFYGHVRRHDTIQKVIVEGKINGKRGRGRKRTNWIGNVAAYTGMNINTCARVAMDREKWRAVTSDVVPDTEQ